MKTKNIKILFIHGFNSAAFGDKVNALRKGFGEQNIIAINLPPSPKKAILLLEYLVKSLKDKDFWIAGSSLGGYYALYLAYKFNVKAILINPAYKVYELMDKHIGWQINYKTGEKYYFKKSYIEELKVLDISIIDLEKVKNNLFIYLDEEDEVLNSKQTADIFKGFYVKMFKGGNHSFLHMNELIEDIKKFLK